MGQVTATAQVWSPDSGDLNEPDVYLATMAQSIEDGLGQRVTKLESFIGINVCLPSTLLVAVGGSPVTVGLQVKNTYNFNSGMTLNADGSITVITAGIYQINLNANFRAATTTAPKLNTYLYNNGNSVAYSSAYGEPDTSRYTNCNVAGVYKLAVGDTISARVLCLDATANLQQDGGTTLSMALTARS